MKNEFNEWHDDLIRCPSQCSYRFKQGPNTYEIYLRWRWDDPWTADLIEHPDTEEEHWMSLDVPYFKENELDKLKEYVINKVVNSYAMKSNVQPNS